MYPYPITPLKTINTYQGKPPNYSVYDLCLTYTRSFFDRDAKNFIDFIQNMWFEFEKVRQGLNYVNEQATHHAGDDVYSAGTAGEGLLPIALYLYYLRSYGIKGKVLECGVFKGGSTCCLSHVCDYLGLQLIAADSFEGLPSSDEYYSKGDFKGSFEEVERNVKKFGKPHVVNFIKGWFAESLKDFDDELLLIWLDVDLKQSVIDVLSNTYSCLVENGVIFSDGLGQTRDFSADRLKSGSSESAGIIEFLEKRGIDHKAIYTGYAWLGLVIPNTKPDDKIIYDANFVKQLASLGKFLNWTASEKIHGIGRKLWTVVQ